MIRAANTLRTSPPASRLTSKTGATGVIRRALCIALALGLAGCSSTTRDADDKSGERVGQPDKSGQPESANDKQKHANGQNAAKPNVTTMTPGFKKAHESFTEFAAKALSVAKADLRVMPNEDSEVAQLRQKLGKAWAFQGTVIKEPQRWVRGWAVADGRVVTPEQNVDVLLQEAGYWSGQPAFSAEPFAELLSWGIRGGAEMQYATLDRKDDGSGTLTFVVIAVEPPMGAHPGPDHYYEYKITTTADGKATVAKRHNQGSAPLP